MIGTGARRRSKATDARLREQWGRERAERRHGTVL